ncbi:hypothetical protein BJV74DRAFT_122829 [Russula compacta]|nr:hypothetical protein BJV74DRAFT_122829 [Russula compacta]
MHAQVRVPRMWPSRPHCIRCRKAATGRYLGASLTWASNRSDCLGPSRHIRGLVPITHAYAYDTCLPLVPPRRRMTKPGSSRITSESSSSHHYCLLPRLMYPMGIRPLNLQSRHTPVVLIYQSSHENGLIHIPTGPRYPDFNHVQYYVINHSYPYPEWWEGFGRHTASATAFPPLLLYVPRPYIPSIPLSEPVSRVSRHLTHILPRSPPPLTYLLSFSYG